MSSPTPNCFDTPFLCTVHSHDLLLHGLFQLLGVFFIAAIVLSILFIIITRFDK